MKKLKLSLVDKYLIIEFIKPFIFLIIALTIIMISSYLFELADLIIVKKVPVNTVLKLLLYKIPDVIVQSFSIATLFSTLLSMTQFVKNNEFTALRMGGISLHRLIIPVLIIGVIISGLNYFINEKVVPWTNHEAENIVRKTILQKGLPNLQEGVFFQVDNRYFYIENIDNKSGTLTNIVLYEFEEDSEDEFPRVITANKGYFQNKIWYLSNGVMHDFDEQGNMISQSNFNELKLNINEKLKNFYGEQKTTSEMSRDELKKDITIFQKSGLSVTSLLVDYHLKLSKVFASLIFILLGIPLSIKTKKGKAFGLIISIIIIFIYYVAISFCRSLGRNDLLNPLVAAWLPNLIFSLLGLYLVFKEEYFKLR
ncbi:LptF/LptG family permease [Orenia marismortui]|uniref:LptF/LptG family permease n=1 Tax=Orenia marismortui TaxID=46469 RepID=UPI00036A1996|nr:LptF/LptG family permease [Orenia marismortui]